MGNIKVASCCQGKITSIWGFDTVNCGGHRVSAIELYHIVHRISLRDSLMNIIRTSALNKNKLEIWGRAQRKAARGVR